MMYWAQVKAAACVVAATMTVAGTGFATCSECPDGSGPYCLTLLADQIVATEIDGTVIEVSEEDIAANPECAE